MSLFTILLITQNLFSAGTVSQRDQPPAEPAVQRERLVETAVGGERAHQVAEYISVDALASAATWYDRLPSLIEASAALVDAE